jgi:hypothetical protein
MPQRRRMPKCLRPRSGPLVAGRSVSDAVASDAACRPSERRLLTSRQMGDRTAQCLLHMLDHLSCCQYDQRAGERRSSSRAGEGVGPAHAGGPDFASSLRVSVAGRGRQDNSFSGRNRLARVRPRPTPRQGPWERRWRRIARVSKARWRPSSARGTRLWRCRVTMLTILPHRPKPSV